MIALSGRWHPSVNGSDPEEWWGNLQGLKAAQPVDPESVARNEGNLAELVYQWLKPGGGDITNNEE